jgi:hypothetical protein
VGQKGPIQCGMCLLAHEWAGNAATDTLSVYIIVIHAFRLFTWCRIHIKPAKARQCSKRMPVVTSSATKSGVSCRRKNRRPEYIIDICIDAGFVGPSQFSAQMGQTYISPDFLLTQLFGEFS